MTDLLNLRAAVIGCGRMGQRHISILRSLDVTNLAICDHRIDGLRVAAQEHHLDDHRLYTDAEQLLTTFKPDLVIVATTANSHHDLVIRAAKAGCPYILCEKPMACSLAECDEMIAACERSRSQLAINHQIRFMPAYTEAAQVIRDESFGGLTSMIVSGGNGGLAMIGSHLFEAFRWLTGESVDSVQAWFSPERIPNPRGPQFEDVGGSVRALTSSGRRLYFDLSADQGHGLTITYTGRHGQVTVEPLHGELQAAVRQARDREQPTTRYTTPSERLKKSFEPGAIEAAKTLIQELVCNGDYPTAVHGKHAVECLVAAHVSHNAGNRPIRRSEIFDYRLKHFPWA